MREVVRSFAVYALLLGAAVGTTLPARAATVAVDVVSAAAGTQDTAVGIALTTTALEKVSGLQFDVVFDAAALALDSTAAGAAATTASKTLSVNQKDANRLSVVIVGFNQNVIASGEVMRAVFDVSAQAPPGQHAISLENLVVTNIYGVSVATSALAGGITIPEPPAAAFSAAPSSGMAPLAVQFTDTSISGGSPITSWTWYFGDGTSSTAANPLHVYSQAGTFTVALTVGSAAGSGTHTETGCITVYGPADAPTADFSATPLTGATPLLVDFTDRSLPGSAPITSWLWSFGDGGASTAANPSHSYAAPGIYDVSLTVTTPIAEDTFTAQALIEAIDPRANPAAGFAAVPAEGVAPLGVTFTDLSTPGPQYITGWLWDFGDGFTSLEQNPVHIYSVPGDYTVQLTVSTVLASDTHTAANLIHVAPVQTGPAAAFIASPETGAAPLTVQFTDTSQPGSAVITQWQWDFGDGQTSTAQHPIHIYTQTGIYDVALTVTTGNGSDSMTRTALISVTSGGQSATGCAGDSRGAASLGGDMAVLTGALTLLALRSLRARRSQARRPRRQSHPLRSPG